MATERELKSLFDAFYDRLVLRDFFGKIVPGAIFLSSLWLSVSPANDIMNTIEYLPLGLWLLGLGLAWVFGFAIQSCGEWAGLIINFPVPEDQVLFGVRQFVRRELNQFPQTFANDAAWYIWREGTYQPSVALLMPEEQRFCRQSVERMAVIKETCGNSYVSIFLTLIVLIFVGVIHLHNQGNFKNFVDLFLLIYYKFIPIILFILGVMSFLCRMHFVHVRRQFLVMQHPGAF